MTHEGPFILNKIWNFSIIRQVLNRRCENEPVLL